MRPMTQQMHRRQTALVNDWAATDHGLFVLRFGQLLKYDRERKLVKTVDLPRTKTAAEEVTDRLNRGVQWRKHAGLQRHFPTLPRCLHAAKTFQGSKVLQPI